MNRRKCHFKGTISSSSFDIFRGLYAFKNSSINFFFRANDNPLWFLNLYFKSAKCPSIALVVLGIFNSMLSYQVKSHGRLVLKLLYALRNLQCTYLFFPLASFFRSLRNSSHLWYHAHSMHLQSFLYPFLQARARSE